MEWQAPAQLRLHPLFHSGLTGKVYRTWAGCWGLQCNICCVYIHVHMENLMLGSHLEHNPQCRCRCKRRCFLSCSA